MDRGTAGEMEVPHHECFLVSVSSKFSGIPPGGHRAGLASVLGIFIPSWAMVACQGKAMAIRGI
jgi:hypothetical protein